MKKVLSVSIVALLILTVAVAVPLLTIHNSRAHVMNTMPQFHAGAFTPLATEDMNIQPLTLGSPRVALTSEQIAPFWDRPYEVRQTYLYVQEANGTMTRAGFIPETGMVVTADGRPVTTEVGAGNLIYDTTVLYDEVGQDFIDAANRRLGIFLDSTNNRNIIQQGTLRARAHVMPHEEIVKVNINTTSGQSIPIYVRLEITRRSNWNSFWSGQRYDFHFFTLRGHRIDNNMLTDFRPPNFWQRMLNRVGTVVGVVTFGGVNILQAAPFVEILNRTTLAELMHHISHATVHPWESLRCLDTNNPVITLDGRAVKLNPNTSQLMDFFGFPLVSTRNGLPIVFHQGDIITTDREPKEIVAGMVQYSTSSRQLVEQGQVFFMSFVHTAFGSFEVPQFNLGTDENPQWVLINGDSAAGITQEIVVDRPQSDESIWNRIGGWFGGGSGFGFFQVLGLILGGLVIVFVIVLFVRLLEFTGLKKKKVHVSNNPPQS